MHLPQILDLNCMSLELVSALEEKEEAEQLEQRSAVSKPEGAAQALFSLQPFFLRSPRFPSLWC